MRKTVAIGLILFTLGVMLVGCGGESATSDPAQTPTDEPKNDQPLAMVLETSEATYWRDGEEAKTIDDVRAMIVGMEPAAEAGYTLSIDPEFDRAGQLRVLLTATTESTSEQDLKAASDKLFDQLKSAFDQRAKDAAMLEEAHHLKQKAQLAKRVKQQQDELKGFLELARGSTSTQASRLARRQLERQIETALVDQIAAEKAAEKAKRRIERERFITLLRVR